MTLPTRSSAVGNATTALRDPAPREAAAPKKKGAKLTGIPQGSPWGVTRIEKDTSVTTSWEMDIYDNPGSVALPGTDHSVVKISSLNRCDSLHTLHSDRFLKRCAQVVNHFRAYPDMYGARVKTSVTLPNFPRNSRREDDGPNETLQLRNIR